MANLFIFEHVTIPRYFEMVKVPPEASILSNVLSDWGEQGVDTFSLYHITLQLRLTGQLPVLMIRPVLQHIKRAWEVAR